MRELETKPEVEKEKQGVQVTLCQTTNARYLLCFFPDCVKKLTLKQFADSVLWSADRNVIWGIDRRSGKAVLYWYSLVRHDEFSQGTYYVFWTVEAILYCEVEKLTNYLVYDRVHTPSQPNLRLVDSCGNCHNSDHPDAACISPTASSALIGRNYGPIAAEIEAMVKKHITENTDTINAGEKTS